MASEYVDLSDNSVCKSCGTGISSCSFGTPSITVSSCIIGYYLENNSCLPCVNNSAFGSNKNFISSCNLTKIITC